MRSVMTVGDLKRYCESRSMKRVLFCSEDQISVKPEDPMKYALAFTSMSVACNPNIVCLRGRDNMLYFEKVKYANVDTERSVLGTVFEVVCDDSERTGKDIHYLIVAS